MGVRFFCGFENNVVILQAQIQQQELLIIYYVRQMTPLLKQMASL